MNSIAIFAILFLLGFGFVIYAVPGAQAVSWPASSSSATSSTSAQSNEVYYRLDQVAPVAVGANASGYAGITITGPALSLEWSVSSAHPGEQLQMVMETASSSGTTKSFTFATVQVSTSGAAGSTGTATLDPGYYYVGLIVVDPSTIARTTVFVSDPASIQVAIASSPTTPTTTAIGNSLSYSLVPLPVYLRQPAPANYSFKEGGALIVTSGDQLQLTTSFIGSADTAFTNVIQTANRNITVGKVTTTSSGGGVFKGNVTLDPGTYQVGVLLFASGDTASPAAVSVPRAIQVTLPPTATSTSSSTSSSSSSSTSSRSSTSESTTTTSTASTSTHSSSATTSSSATSSASPESVNQLEFTPMTSASTPRGYQYGEGGGAYSVTGGNIYFSLGFTGQNPATHYSLVLSVNGTARTIGDYTTNSNGGGTVAASTTLGAGRFALSMTIFDLSTFDQPTAVLASVPSSFSVNAYGTPTTTTTARSTTSSFLVSPTLNGPEWTFKLTQAVVENVPKGYRFASTGTAVVTLDTEYSLLNVELGFQDANPSTTYTAAMILNGTSVNLGTLTTNRAGGAVLQSSIQVSAGKYLFGIQVYDISDIAAFKADGPVLVMVNDPNSQLAVVVPPMGTSSSTSTSSASSSQGSTTSSQPEVTSTVTKTVTTINAGTKRSKRRFRTP